MTPTERRREKAAVKFLSQFRRWSTPEEGYLIDADDWDFVQAVGKLILEVQQRRKP